MSLRTYGRTCAEIRSTESKWKAKAFNLKGLVDAFEHNGRLPSAGMPRLHVAQVSQDVGGKDEFCSVVESLDDR